MSIGIFNDSYSNARGFQIDRCNFAWAMINSLKSTGAKMPFSKSTGAIAPVATELTTALNNGWLPTLRA